MIRPGRWVAVSAFLVVVQMAGCVETQAGTTVPEPVAIHFAEPTGAGLTVSISIVGDPDGKTVLSNERCCGIADVRTFIKDVRVATRSTPLSTTRTASGWIVLHEPSAPLEVTYRLPSLEPMVIDAGMSEQMKPIVGEDYFHLMGSTALLLPKGRSADDPVALSLSADGITEAGAFVSSFGLGPHQRPVTVPRGTLTRALYLGGAVSLDVFSSSTGSVGVVQSGMGEAFEGNALHGDVIAIVEAERAFFGEGQPWYLVSVHGGQRSSPEVNVGGGVGLTDSFAMFVRSDLDFSVPEHREHFRWVFAHEYFHHWIGLTLRIAPVEGTSRDDTSNYWFTEGFTEFLAMRLLTRTGLQTPERALAVLNHKLARYATNRWKGLGAEAAGEMFWSDHDAQQIPYLRGYLAAWFIEQASGRGAGRQSQLDALVQALVDRASREPDLRVDTGFLVNYLGHALEPVAAGQLRKFIVDGGDAPFDADTLAPCLAGHWDVVFDKEVLQFAFSKEAPDGCFAH